MKRLFRRYNNDEYEFNHKLSKHTQKNELSLKFVLHCSFFQLLLSSNCFYLVAVELCPSVCVTSFLFLLPGFLSITFILSRSNSSSIFVNLG